VVGQLEPFLLLAGLVIALMLGEVYGCDLQAVEKQAGAAEIDVVSCDGAHDDAEGVLNVGAGARVGNDVGPGAGLARADLLRCSAELVVVVAAVTAAECWTAAARAIRVFLGAACAVELVFVVCKHVFDIVILVEHGFPRYLFVQSLLNRVDIGAVPLVPC
jgi:hypothetical protein